MKLFYEFLWIFIVLVALQGSQCLRNVHMVVPEAAQRGSRIEMKCLYDLEKEELYSVKWYRGDREFCRYSPRDVPSLMIFDLPGIDVDKNGSDAHRVVLTPAGRSAHGQYTCEVSADAPSFQTAQVHAYMHVVELPTSEPSMHGLQRRYRPGMKLQVECSSRNSSPAANISLFVNNEPALTQHVWHRVEAEGKGQLWTAYSTIQFVVQPQHFVRGKIKIRCTAIIYSIYVKSVEKSAEEERIRTTPSSAVGVNKVVANSIHHLPQTNTSSQARNTATTTRIVSLILLVLPSTLR